MKPLPKYTEIKDKCCIFYLGTAFEYLVQLTSLMPYIKKSIPGITLDVFGKDCYCKDISGLLPLSLLEKDQYGFAEELAYDLHSHPVLKFLEELNVKYGEVELKITSNTNICAICCESGLPAKSLTTLQIEKAKMLAVQKGYNPIITDDISNVGWIIGAENGPLFLGAVRGIKTSLIPTGLGTKLYKTMFPNGEILNF